MKNKILICSVFIFLTLFSTLFYMVFFEKDVGFKALKKSVISEELAVNPEDGEVIRELIFLMSRTNPAILALKKSKLEALGARLKNKVNTYEFLAFVFKDKELALEMKLLKESSIKYKRFVEGLHPKMMREYEGEVFLKRTHNFAKVLDIDLEEFKKVLYSCLENAQKGNKIAFMPMVDFLIHQKTLEQSLGK
jgi:hypothetical protein